MARPIHTLDLEARTLTSQTFNRFRELVTILHREIRARLDQVELYIYLFRIVIEECMHTFVAILTPRGPEENQESNRWSLNLLAPDSHIAMWLKP